MTVQCLLFASYRDFAGTGSLSLDLASGATARDAIALLRSVRPGAARIPIDPIVAVNEVTVPLDTVLTHGDEVAVLPPVAGG